VEAGLTATCSGAGSVALAFDWPSKNRNNVRTVAANMRSINIYIWCYCNSVSQSGLKYATELKASCFSFIWCPQNINSKLDLIDGIVSAVDVRIKKTK
jgi:hypothetical protein